MKTFVKKDFPLTKIRRYLEPGPIVLVSSAWNGKTDIMTMGWHMMMGFTPALFGCYIWDGDHSFEMMRRSKQCVINLPTTDLINEAIGIGNSTGAEIDKFEKFGLTPVAAAKVDAPLIKECYANFECRLADGSQIRKHGLFIWEVVKAHVATSPKYPKTFHYRGDGVFMISDGNISRRRLFKPQNL
jgi:flavin reductase (DIM6/NTAB) family NADH-FMN oxidoreductase RutF